MKILLILYTYIYTRSLQKIAEEMERKRKMGREGGRNVAERGKKRAKKNSSGEVAKRGEREKRGRRGRERMKRGSENGLEEEEKA